MLGRYLCHFWRQSLAPVHDFVNRQPSKPDDIAINLLIQHLSGKGPRNYPQVTGRSTLSLFSFLPRDSCA